MFKLKNYIFVPKDVFSLSKKAWFWSHYTDWLGVLILFLYAVVFGLLFDVSGEPLFFIGFIIAIIYWRMDSRVSIALALVCLVCIPILLTLFNKDILFKGEIWAEQVAVWAYYFLVIGVVRQIFEYKEEEKEKRKKSKENKNKKTNHKTIIKTRHHIVNLKKENLNAQK
ncbi:hypothetical protein KAI92_04440 [Candidatus Parcubacteria bacterium]|nr:hypothetical protein [Candidatus Parcubacteria bacterium]